MAAEAGVAAAAAHRPITLWNKLIYAAPAFAMSAASIFHATYQAKYYVDDLAMPPRTYALANALVRSIDLFGYPVMGWLADNTFVDGNPFVRGRRKPFLLLSAPIAAAALFLLYSPPTGLPMPALQMWYTVIATVYSGVPLSLAFFSLGTELTPAYDEQASVFGWVHILSSAGMIVGSLVPGLVASTAATSHVVMFPLFALAIALTLLGTIILLVTHLQAPSPHGIPHPHPATDDGGGPATHGGVMSGDGARQGYRGDGGLWEAMVALGKRTRTTMRRIVRESSTLPTRRADGAGGASAGGDRDGDGRSPRVSADPIHVARGKGGRRPSQGYRAGWTDSNSDGGSEEGEGDDEEGGGGWVDDRECCTNCIIMCGRRRAAPQRRDALLAGQRAMAAARGAEVSVSVHTTGVATPLAMAGGEGGATLRRRGVVGGEEGDVDAVDPAEKGTGAMGAGKEGSGPFADPPVAVGDGVVGVGRHGGGRWQGGSDGITGRPRDAPRTSASVCSCLPQGWRWRRPRPWRDGRAGSGGYVDSSHMAQAHGQGHPAATPSCWTRAASACCCFWTCNGLWCAEYDETDDGGGRHGLGGASGSVTDRERDGTHPAPEDDITPPEESQVDEVTRWRRSIARSQSFYGVASAEWTVVTWPIQWPATYGDGVVPPMPIAQLRDMQFPPPATSADDGTVGSGAGAAWCCGRVGSAIASMGRRVWAGACGLSHTRRLWHGANGRVAPSTPLTEPVVLIRAGALTRAAMRVRRRWPDLPQHSAPTPSTKVLAPSYADEGGWVVLAPRNRLTTLVPPGSPASAHVEGRPSGPTPSAAVAADVGALLRAHRRVVGQGTRLDVPLPIGAGVAWAARSLPFRVVTGIIMLLTLASVLTHALLAFYIQYVLAPPTFELWVGLTLTAELIASALATPAWYALSTRLDQRRAWIIALAAALPGTAIAFSVLGRGDIVPFMACAVWGGLTEGGASFLLQSYRTWVIAYDHLHTGMRRESQYLTYFAVFASWVAIPATGIAMAALAGAGYAPNAPQQPDAVVHLLKLLTLGMPLAFCTAAWVVLWLFPIDRATHAALFGGGSDTAAPAPAGGVGGDDDKVDTNAAVCMQVDAGSPASAQPPSVALQPPLPLLGEDGTSWTPGAPTCLVQSCSGEGGCAAPRATRLEGVWSVCTVCGQVRHPAPSPSPSSAAPAAATTQATRRGEARSEQQSRQHGCGRWCCCGGGQAGDGDSGAPCRTPPAAPPDHVLWDPITYGYIMPTFVYRSSGCAWLLDHFSTATLAQILRHRAHVRAAAVVTPPPMRAGRDGGAGGDGGQAGDHPLSPRSPPDTLIYTKEQVFPPLVAVRSRYEEEKMGEGGAGLSGVPSASTTMAQPFHPAGCADRGDGGDADGGDTAPIPAASAICCCGCGRWVSPRWYLPLVAQQVIATVFWAATAIVSIWMIVVGASNDQQPLAWGAMLLLGVAGLASMYHGLRIRPAMKVAHVPDATISRYLALYQS